jgi:hypothetical protein
MVDQPIVSFTNDFLTEKVIERVLFDKVILQNSIASLVHSYMNAHPGVLIGSIEILPAAYGVECHIKLKL